MDISQARQEARKRWGGGGWVLRRQDTNPRRRFVVGKLGTLNALADPIPLGWGNSWEAAFADADATTAVTTALADASPGSQALQAAAAEVEPPGYAQRERRHRLALLAIITGLVAALVVALGAAVG